MGGRLMNYSAFWKDYRKTTGTLTWRLATPDDLPAIRRLRNISEWFLKQPQRNPTLFDLPILLTIVAENQRGQIVDALYVEAQIELVKMACTAKGFEESAGLEEDLSRWLKDIGFKTVHLTTPLNLKEKMRAIAEKLGFKCQDDLFSYWKRRL